MRYSKYWNAGIGCLNLTLGARKVIWTFLFHFSFVSSASWLFLRGGMSIRHQVVIALLRIVFSCNGWLWHAVLISCIRIIHLHGFFFVSWASSHAKDDCYMGCTHHSLQDNLKSMVCSMFTVPNVFGAWHWSGLLTLFWGNWTTTGCGTFGFCLDCNWTGGNWFHVVASSVATGWQPVFMKTGCTHSKSPKFVHISRTVILRIWSISLKCAKWGDVNHF